MLEVKRHENYRCSRDRFLRNAGHRDLYPPDLPMGRRAKALQGPKIRLPRILNESNKRQQPFQLAEIILRIELMESFTRSLFSKLKISSRLEKLQNGEIKQSSRGGSIYNYSTVGCWGDRELLVVLLGLGSTYRGRKGKENRAN